MDLEKTGKRELADLLFSRNDPDGHEKQLEEVEELIFLHIQEGGSYCLDELHVLCQDLGEDHKQIEGFLYQKLTDSVPEVRDILWMRLSHNGSGVSCGGGSYFALSPIAEA